MLKPCVLWKRLSSIENEVHGSVEFFFGPPQESLLVKIFTQLEVLSRFEDL